jgi:type IV pilus assembly protein PilE
MPPPAFYSSAGITLAELVVAVAIVGILLGIAIPSYKNHIVRANRSAAQQYMMNASNREEQALTDLRRYIAVTSNANFVNAPTAGSPGLTLPVPPEVASNYNFVVTTTDGPPPTYTIRATPISGTMQSNDHAMYLDNSGNKWRDLNDNSTFDPATEDWSKQ